MVRLHIENIISHIEDLIFRVENNIFHIEVTFSYKQSLVMSYFPHWGGWQNFKIIQKYKQKQTKY